MKTVQYISNYTKRREETMGSEIWDKGPSPGVFYIIK